jgi:hypothetical protein
MNAKTPRRQEETQSLTLLGVLAPWRSFILCCFIFAATSARAAVSDQSLTPEQYVAKGAPASDRLWTGKDYAAANDVLSKLADSDPSALPRFHSPRSGAYFDRFISPENIAPLKNQKLSINTRMALGLDLFEGPKQLAVVYMNAAKPGAVFDEELAELLGYQLVLIGSSLDVIEQFVKELDPADPKLRVRVDGLMQLRSGLATVIDGCLIATTEAQIYRVESRRRLGDFLSQTLPRIAIELPRLTREELPNRLSQMAEKESDPTLKATLNKLSVQMKSIGPSRIDAAVATVQSKAKSMPQAPPPRVVWSWHTSSAGGFRAEFPGTPDEQTHTGTSKSGKPLRAIILGLKADDGSTFSLIHIEGDTQLPDLASIDQMLTAMFPGAKVLDKSEFDAPVGRRGRQMLLRSDRTVLAIRAAYMKGVIYEAIVETPGQTEDKMSDSAKRFLESFEITQK